MFGQNISIKYLSITNRKRATKDETIESDFDLLKIMYVKYNFVGAWGFVPNGIIQKSRDTRKYVFVSKRLVYCL